MTVAVLDPPILGCTEPRLFTAPLVTGEPGPCGCGCALDESTSYGFRVARFAEEKLGRPLWPWQRWFVIHAGELSLDGVPRFRRVIVTVGRQSGKTEVVLALTLFWLVEERKPSILGTSTLTKYAKKPWASAFKLAVEKLPERMPENPHRKAIRKAAGEEEWWTADDCHYAIAASNAEGGRSMTNQRVIADELAKQYSYEAYGAAYFSMDAVEDAQYFGITTPDPKGEVYNDLREAALSYLETGEGDPTLGLFEWSSPSDADPADARALAMANPTLGRPGGKKVDRLLNEARGAVAKGGQLLRTFMTEVMCIQVEHSDPAVDPGAWLRCLDPGDLTAARSRLAVCLDVSPAGDHATLAAAAVLDDGRVRVETVHAWEGPAAAATLERELAGWVVRLKPQTVGWFPSGPAAALAAKLADRRKDGVRGWPPRGVSVSEIRGETTAVVMGFGKEIAACTLAHSGQALLDTQVAGAEKLARGDGWVFTRRGGGNVDSVYAAAGAVHLARTLPTRRAVSRKVHVAPG